MCILRGMRRGPQRAKGRCRSLDRRRQGPSSGLVLYYIEQIELIEHKFGTLIVLDDPVHVDFLILALGFVQTFGCSSSFNSENSPAELANPIRLVGKSHIVDYKRKKRARLD